MNADRSRALIWVVVLPVVLLSVVGQVRFTESRWPMDFYHYWVADKIVTDERPVNLYAPERRTPWASEFRSKYRGSRSEKLRYSADVWKDGLRLTGTPFFYMSLAPFMTDDYDGDLERFRLFSLVLYWTGLLLIARRLRFPWPLALLSLLLFSGRYLPQTHDVWVGNVNQIIVGAVGLLFYGLGAKKTRGALEASAALFAALLIFKPVLVYSFVLLIGAKILSRDGAYLKRFATPFAVVLALGWAASSLYFGSGSIWLDWLASTAEMLSGPRYASLTLLGQLTEQPAPGWFFAFALVLLSFPLLAQWRLGAARLPVKETYHEVFYVSFGLLIYLMAGNVLHSHYFVMAAPLVLFLFAAGEVLRESDGPRARWTAAAALVGYGMICGNFFQVLIPLEATYDITAWNHVGLILLFGASCYPFVRAVRRRESMAPAQRATP